MRIAIPFVIGLLLVAVAPAWAAERYGIEPDQENFPQKTPKDALASIIKALQMKKVDYIVAQLADPQWVDQRIKQVHAGRFEEMVKETQIHLVDDPDTVKQLRRFLKDGEWEVGENQANAKVKDLKDRVFFRKYEDRWFLENRRKDEKAKDKAKEKEKE